VILTEDKTVSYTPRTYSDIQMQHILQTLLL